MKDDDRQILMLAGLGVLALLFLVLFHDIIRIVFMALGMLLCLILLVLILVAVVVLVATIFLVPYYMVKKPTKAYYKDYTIEEVKGMDEGPENSRGPPRKP